MNNHEPIKWPNFWQILLILATIACLVAFSYYFKFKTNADLPIYNRSLEDCIRSCLDQSSDISSSSGTIDAADLQSP